MNCTKSDIQSEQLVIEIINLVRFPLAVLVVFIHTCSTQIDLTDSLHIVYQLTRAFFSIVLASVAVPTFFLISGYLFYKKLEEWNWHTYYKKLKRRFFSLFVPYLIWNTLYIIFALSGAIYSVVFNGTSYTVLIDWVQSQGFFHLYWDEVYLVPLWFVRDLMLMVLFASVIYGYVKYLRNFGFLFLIVLFFFCDFIPSSFVFFTLGSFFCLFPEKVNYLLDNRIRLLVIVSFMATLAFNLYGMYVNLGYLEILQKCKLLLGVFAVMSIGYELKNKGCTPLCRFLAEGSFFVFVFHYFLCYDISRIIRSMIGTNSQSGLVLIYFLSVFFVVCSCVIMYMLLRKYMSPFSKILTGGR